MGAFSSLLGRAAFLAACTIVPPLLVGRDWWFVGRSFDAFSQPFEILGLIVSATVLAAWAVAWNRRDRLEDDTIVRGAVVGGLLLGAVYLVTNFPSASWDYGCYDRAARAVVAGTNPYDGTSYLYPPLLAQTLATVQTTIAESGWFRLHETSSWWISFYVFQVAQLALVVLLAEQCFALGRRLGIPLAWTATLTLASFLLSTPLYRTLAFDQVNLVVVLALVVSLAQLDRRPIVAGALMALAVSIKPQGLPFPLLWLWLGHRRAAVSFLGAAIVLVLVQADFGRNWTTWSQFFASLDSVPKYNGFFRNQSLFSFTFTLTRTVGLTVDKPTLMLFVRGVQALVVLWFAWRFVQRERRFRGHDDALPMRLGTHTCDLVLLALLMPPLVWEHHFVIALPLLFWIFAVSNGRVSALALAGLALMLVPSTFDVWLFSYHRLAGVVLFTVATSPGRIQALRARARPYPAVPATPD